MKICAVQYQPVSGSFSENLDKHLDRLEAARRLGADVVFFPELSLTGYEPRLARALAAQHLDTRLDGIQMFADRHGITVGVGLPRWCGHGVQIAMIWHSPAASPKAYAKQHLHADELAYFVPGEGPLALGIHGETLVPAICYESLLEEHAACAGQMGAEAYLASVAKSARGVDRAMGHYPEMARRHGMFVLMANSVGPADDFVSHGHSAAWGRDGRLLAQLDAQAEGSVILDTATATARCCTNPDGP